MASKNDIQISWRAGIGWWCPRARRGTVIRFPDTRDHPISFSQSLAGFDSDDLVSAAHCFIHFDFGKGGWTFVSSFILYNSGKRVRTSVFKEYMRDQLLYFCQMSHEWKFMQILQFSVSTVWEERKIKQDIKSYKTRSSPEYWGSTQTEIVLRISHIQQHDVIISIE